MNRICLHDELRHSADSWLIVNRYVYYQKFTILLYTYPTTSSISFIQTTSQAYLLLNIGVCLARFSTDKILLLWESISSHLSTAHLRWCGQQLNPPSSISKTFALKLKNSFYEKLRGMGWSKKLLLHLLWLLLFYILYSTRRASFWLLLYLSLPVLFQ